MDGLQTIISYERMNEISEELNDQKVFELV